MWRGFLMLKSYYESMSKTSEDPAVPRWAEIAKARMADLGIVQDDLCRVFGVETRGAVGHYFRGRREPTIWQLIRLARVLDLTVSELVGEHEIPGDTPEHKELYLMLRDLPTKDIPSIKAYLLLLQDELRKRPL